jgi:hypothetical protein
MQRAFQSPPTQLLMKQAVAVSGQFVKLPLLTVSLCMYEH